ncbi:MAG TPA: flagellar basal body L-ring protein FlgH [Paucimonas sp.]|nr:flagellar basal body L-ring protein FlgH [Paucimonas sp.]
MRKIVYAGWAILAACLAGCAATPSSIVQLPTTARPAPNAAAKPANGAIFHSASYRPMFEDRRARLVGDVLTIAISENTSAAKAAANSGSNSGSGNMSFTTLFGVSTAAKNKLGVSTEGENTFDEKGAQSASNSFTGTISVTVIDVFPNGNLLVSGEKQISFDKGAEFVRFSGVVNPDTIAAGNVVSSTKVADARVEYRSNSRIDRAEVLSLLTRFFMSVFPL